MMMFGILFNLFKRHTIVKAFSVILVEIITEPYHFIHQRIQKRKLNQKKKKRNEKITWRP